MYSPQQLYRRIHLGNPGDIDVYLRAAEGSQSILDLGCGWGRLTIPLAQRGHQVTAIDLEPEFLDELNRELERLELRKSIAVYQMDIRRLALEHTGLFDRIFVPYNTLYSLEGIEGVESCLRAARRLLAERGELWFDVYDMDAFHEEYDANDDCDIAEPDNEPVASFDHGGRNVLVTERTDVDHARKRLTVDYTAQFENTDDIVGTLSMMHDYFLVEELHTALEKADLELLDRLLPSVSQRKQRRSLEQPIECAEVEDEDDDEPEGPVFFAATVRADP